MFGLSKMLLLAATVAGQVTFLGGMIAVDSLPYQFGETIRLKVEPVDPRDMFRGDYVVLGYDFTRTSSHEIKDLPADWSDYVENEVFIRLKRAEDVDHWELDEITARQPKEGLYLRGKTSPSGRFSAGIEAYFVQEGQGLNIEQAMRARRPVFAEVAVWRGTAKLKRVVVE